jgi:hypothetical protein
VKTSSSVILHRELCQPYAAAERLHGAESLQLAVDLVDAVVRNQMCLCRIDIRSADSHSLLRDIDAQAVVDDPASFCQQVVEGIW